MLNDATRSELKARLVALVSRLESSNRSRANQALQVTPVPRYHVKYRQRSD
jgi:hypothetical protein